MKETEFLTRAVPPLLGWFRLHKRDLPWRKARTPYTVLVSELMLQQTRAEAVRDRYARFLEHFPTAEALAAADEDEVLKEWEGLGYYSRARNLWLAAKEIAANGFPRTWEGVRSLPGVGDYTAGAVSSIALGLPCPAVDGNVLRILTRLLADARNVDDAASKRYFYDLLKEVYPPEAGEFTEALMELGAVVCVPNGAPMCGACPWNSLCRAHLMAAEQVFPVRKEVKERKVVEASVFIVEERGRFAVEKRPQGGLLAGMYGFPIREGSYEGRAAARMEAKHVFTHVEWHMTGYLLEGIWEEAEAELSGRDVVWATAEELKTRYAIPSAFKAFFRWIV